MNACMHAEWRSFFDRDGLVGEAEVAVALLVHLHRPPCGHLVRASEDQILAVSEVELAKVVARVGDHALGLYGGRA